MSKSLFQLEKKLALPPYADQDFAWREQFVDNYWMNLGDTSQIHTVNPFSLQTRYDLENPHVFLLDLMRRPEYFHFTAKHIFGKTLPPFQLAILREMWRRPFLMLVGSRGAGKSWLLAFYAMLKSFFNQGTKVVVCGSAFRQAKVVFDYCAEIWDKSPVLRDLVGPGKFNGPRRDVDRCSLRMGDSVITALPIGDGQKIRGQRASIVMADEFASVPVEIFETVIRGFGAVSKDPVLKLQQEARVEALKVLGAWNDVEEAEEDVALMGNQNIISGTAYYAFNHFYAYWKRYKAIVESQGDKRKLEEIFSGTIPEKFNWKDYSVIRIPASELPPGFMDQRQIAQAKATVHIGTFQMEYGACTDSEAIVVTDVGAKRMRDMQVGDRVLTHRGRFMPVSHVSCKPYDGPAFQWKTFGFNQETITTAEHPFWNGGIDWRSLDCLGPSTKLSNLKSLSGLQDIDVTQFIGDKDWMESTDETIYPKHSQSRFSREDLSDIREKSTSMSQSAIAREYGVHHSAIHTIMKQRRRPKNAIPKSVPLKYDFGLIVGYYAAEGSIGADGRACAFSLDGHVNERLEYYVVQLCSAIERTFGVTPKVYQRNECNTANVTVNSTLFTALMSSICPGVAETKFVLPEILFSNLDFIRGFLVGYWNGDGHNPDNRTALSSSSVSLSLSSQVKTLLSSLGIASSLIKTKDESIAVFHEKEYLTKPAWSVQLHGENTQRFRHLLFGGDETRVRLGGRNQTILNDGHRSEFQLRSVERIHFTGDVYNLVVPEDHSYSLVNATTHNCFATDSNGFYKRGMIEKCVVGSPTNPVIMRNGEVRFHCVTKGQAGCQYVMAIDPASETDNLSITILELWPDHRRIVYQWTTNRARYKAKLKSGLTQSTDYYGYAARKVRDLQKVFDIERIAMDTQGGGYGIMEALQDPDKFNEDEQPILPIIVEGDEKDTDDMPGEHILEMINFALGSWVSDANHGMRKDFEDRVLLFPEFNSALLGLAIEDDKMSGRVTLDVDDSAESRYDTLEDAIMEIEELKDELATIVHTQTGTSLRDRWDTPETKIAGGKKGRLRKDRYSSLLMANMVARTLQRAPKQELFRQGIGGFAGDMASSKASGALYTGPQWCKVDAQDYVAVARRR